MAEAQDLSRHACTWQGTHFEIGPPTLQRQEVHQRADGRTSEMGVTEGSVIYQTESLAPIRHLQKSSAR